MSGCEEVRELLVAVARAETVSASGQTFLREHVENCPQCRRKLANQRMLSAGLLVAAAASPAKPPAAVKVALLREFRRQRTVAPMRRPVLWWTAIASVAAALLVAAMLETLRRPPVITPRLVAPPPPVVATAPVPAAPAPPPRRRVKARVLPPVPKVEEAPEVATDFFEIPYSEPLRPDERADVIRIQMPRANIAAFGLPVSGGRLDSRVTADVLMGEDGVARAVRLIR